MAKQLSSEDMGAVESATIDALRDLAEGTLSDVIDLKVNTNEIFESFDFDEAATRELWLRLFYGIQHLARKLLGEETGDPIAEFRAVKSDAVSAFDLADLQLDGIDEMQFVSAFAGPHQLASLLIQAGDTLLSQSVTQLPPPNGMDDSWSEVLKALAKRRPYLWTNRHDATRLFFVTRIPQWNGGDIPAVNGVVSNGVVNLAKSEYAGRAIVREIDRAKLTAWMAAPAAGTDCNQLV